MSKSLTITAPQIVQTRNTLNAVPSGSTAEADYNVKYVPQTLTEEQQAQARENIGAAAAGSGGEQIQSDWNQSDDTKVDYIKNKPSIPAAQIQSDWNQTNSSSADYIKNKPTIPAAQVQADWNQTNTSAADYIKNKPTISGGTPAEIDKYFVIKSPEDVKMSISGTVTNVWENGVALTPDANDRYSVSGGSTVRIEASNNVVFRFDKADLSDLSNAVIYLWVPTGMTLSSNPLPYNTNSIIVIAPTGSERWTTSATVYLLNNTFWYDTPDCGKIVLTNAPIDLTHSRTIEMFSSFTARFYVLKNMQSAWKTAIDQLGWYYPYTVQNYTTNYDVITEVENKISDLSLEFMPLEYYEDNRLSMVVYSDRDTSVSINGSHIVAFMFANGDCIYNKESGTGSLSQIKKGKNVIGFPKDLSGVGDYHCQIEMSDKAGNYTIFRNYTEGEIQLPIVGDNYTGKLNIILGKNFPTTLTTIDLYLPSGTNVNCYLLNNLWSNASNLNLYGNIIFADKDFPTVASGSAASVVPSTTNVTAFYVPRNRVTDFTTFLTALYDGLDITSITSKIVQYDFLTWVDDHTPKMITLSNS